MKNAQFDFLSLKEKNSVVFVSAITANTVYFQEEMTVQSSHQLLDSQTRNTCVENAEY